MLIKSCRCRSLGVGVLAAREHEVDFRSERLCKFILPIFLVILAIIPSNSFLIRGNGCLRCSVIFWVG